MPTFAKLVESTDPNLTKAKAFKVSNSDSESPFANGAIFTPNGNVNYYVTNGKNGTRYHATLEGTIGSIKTDLWLSMLLRTRIDAESKTLVEPEGFNEWCRTNGIATMENESAANKVLSELQIDASDKTKGYKSLSIKHIVATFRSIKTGNKYDGHLCQCDIVE